MLMWAHKHVSYISSEPIIKYYVPPLTSSCPLRQMKLPQSFYTKMSKLIHQSTGTYNLVILHCFLLIPNFTYTSLLLPPHAATFFPLCHNCVPLDTQVSHYSPFQKEREIKYFNWPFCICQASTNFEEN